MRVLLVLGTSSGGVGRHVHGLARGLAAVGHSVRVACPQEVEDQFAFSPVGARHLPLAISDRPSPLGDLRAIARLGDLLRQADVVHAHGLRAGALAVVAALGSSVPVVVTLHNAAPAGRLTAAVYAVLERVVARRATVVLGVSADLVERMERLGARSAGLAVIPGPPPPAQGPDRTSVRSALGLHDGELLVVVAARLAPQKGLPLLLDALAGLRDLPLRVAVAGDGPLRGELEARVASEGLPVLLLGHRTDVPALYAASDVVVSSAVWEGQPIGLQEALHAGTAIVATDVGGTGAVLRDAARLVPGGDAAELARGIREVVTDDELRSSLRARARRRAAELPSEQDAVDAASAIYAQVTTAR